MPQLSIIGGRLHADTPLELQEFIVVPVGEEALSQAVYMPGKIRRAAGGRVRQVGHSALVGDGSGFAPSVAQESACG
jgi:enolase